jgi:protein SCO1/2/putative membrane protein
MFRPLAVLLLLVIALPALAQAEKLFQPYGKPVCDFDLEERDGTEIRSRDLLGKIWVVQFFYPGCNLCSKNTPTMKRLQDIYRGKADVRLVSIDLNDSGLETLRQFAKDHDAEPGQWLFLTGLQSRVFAIVEGGFGNTVFKNPHPTPGDEIIHTTRLVLIDHSGIMVGYVDGTKDNAADALKVEIDALRSRRRLEQRIPITGADMPWFNAILNSSCTVRLLLGWIAIRLRFVTLHKIAMLLALAVSMAFLASYLFYHFVVMEMESTRFRGEGTVRSVYLAILLTHTLLAIVVAPLVILTAVMGLRNSLATHVKIARWTLPIWLYVSVTGVVVYWMLYRVEW